MQIDIQARDFSLTDALQRYVERRLRFAMTCCDDHIQRVVVRLSDSNRPRGGMDKRCALKVVLAGLSNVVVEYTEADLYIAIGHAVDNAGRAVALKIDRTQILLKPAPPFLTDAL